MSARWDSVKFWEQFTEDVVAAAVDGDGEPYAYSNRPQQVGNLKAWFGGGVWSLKPLALTDVPSGDQWRESLILRPKVWRVPDETTPMDAKVWVRDSCGAEWLPRHFATLGRAWDRGYTSWSAGGDMISWHYIVLADVDNPSQPPPLDWEPPKPEVQDEQRPQPA